MKSKKDIHRNGLTWEKTDMKYTILLSWQDAGFSHNSIRLEAKGDAISNPKNVFAAIVTKINKQLKKGVKASYVKSPLNKMRIYWKKQA